MVAILEKLKRSGNLSQWVVLIGIGAILALSGCADIETRITFYENEQWAGLQTVSLSPEAASLLAAGDSSASELNRQIQQAQEAALRPDLDYVFRQETRQDGSMVLTAEGTGQGYETLNQLFFDSQADISAQLVGEQRQVTLRQMDVPATQVADFGGSNLVRITGDRLIFHNADQAQVNSTAIWENPFDLEVTVTEVSGAPPPVETGAQPAAAVPSQGGEPGEAEPAQPEEIDVIRNGGFEEPWQGTDGVGPEWEAYSNGRAHFGWYNEQWAEAVRRGEQAQLMEIFQVEANVLDRIIAIHQTVDVAPNSEYDLTLYAILRSDADENVRNKFEQEMHWGIDPWGEGNYNNVEEWVLMPLTEQFRLGSTAPYPHDIPLFYEKITGTVRTGDTDQITLFIRGIKKFPTNVEVNYDVDEVSLVGPPPGAAPAIEAQTPSQPAAPAPETSTMPDTGATVVSPASVGQFVLGSLVLVVVGIGATAHLLYKRKNRF